MNTENEKRLDDLFKKKLEDPVDEIRYEEGDWGAMEQMLGKPRRKVFYLWPVLSGIAALLLVFFGWWIFKPGNGTNSNNQLVKDNSKKTDTILEHKTQQLQAANQTKKDTILENKQIATARPAKKDTIIGRVQVAAAKKPLKQSNNLIQKPIAPVVNNNQPLYALTPTIKQTKDTIIGNKPANKVSDQAVAVNQTPVVQQANTAPEQPDVQKRIEKAKAEMAVTPVNKPRSKPQMAYRPQYALSVLAAPDINGVGSSFQQGKVGTNIGLLFSMGVSRKFTISTGALYSVKPYLTNFSDYHTVYQFKTNPTNVTADCRMIDVPINVAYQVYHKQQNKISVGTGLSSYLMLHENYKFNYEYAGSGPTNFNVPNPGKYFLGVVNLNATYERQVNSKMGVSIQPYMKLPLSNIGYSQVKLQTTGVAVGLTWNLNSLSKP